MTDSKMVGEKPTELEEKLYDVVAFLQKNGFTRLEPNSYGNDVCCVVLTEDGYEVGDNSGNAMYSKDWQIYWLIGNLTYRGFLAKNYNQ